MAELGGQIHWAWRCPRSSRNAFSCSARSLEAGAVIDGRGVRRSAQLALGFRSFSAGLRLRSPMACRCRSWRTPASPRRRLSLRLRAAAQRRQPADRRHLLRRRRRGGAGGTARQYPALRRGPRLGDPRGAARGAGRAAHRAVRRYRGVLGRARGVPQSGLSAALFHPPRAIRCPMRCAWPTTVALDRWDAGSLFAAIRDYSTLQWRRRASSACSIALFMAGPADRRWAVMQRFYRLREPLIQRFYAAELTHLDRLRIVSANLPCRWARRCGRWPPAICTRTDDEPGNRRCEAGGGDRCRFRRAGVGDPPAARRRPDDALLEKRDKPGGRAYVYHDRGFTFDAGPGDHRSAGVGRTLQRRRQAHGRLCRAAAGRPLLPAVLGGGRLQLRLRQRRAQLDRQIHALNPRDVAGYQRFLAYSRAVYEEGYVARHRALPVVSQHDRRRAAAAAGLAQRVYSMVAKFVENDRLRRALSFHSLLVGGNPFETSSIYALIHAGAPGRCLWFPRGGTGALVQGWSGCSKIWAAGWS